MNVKKMFASLTGVLMLAQLAPVAVLGAASYGAELEGAYKYAFEKGITTMASIDSANMYGELTRGQLAKMISNWAEAELGQKADATKVCSFTDESKAEGDLAMYVKKACQMGLMGQGIAEFRPNAKVTRGEFGTTLSRALWGDKYNTTANPYYINHLAALKDAGIMKMIETPNQLEIRGYVMLMLQRAVAAKAKANCTDPVIALACQLGGENCPAECKKDMNNERPRAGDLKVKATPATERKAIIGAVSDLDTITLEADQAITLDKVVLERYGYSAATDVKAVWLENANGVKITNERSLNSKDEVSLSVNRDYRQLSKNDLFTIVVELENGTGVKAGTLGFKVKSVESSAKNLDLSSYTPFQYDMVRYSGTKVSLSAKGKGRTYHYAPSKAYEVARLQVRASNAAILAKGFTFTNDADKKIDLDRYLDKVEVLVDGKAVNGLKYSVKRDELNVSFDDVKIEIRKNATFVVNVMLKDLDRFGNKIKFKLASTSDFNAVEEKTRARATIETLPSDWKEYVFNGSEIRVTNTKMPSTIDAAKGSEEVVIGEGKVELSEPVKLNTFKVVATETGIDTMKLVAGYESFDATRDATKKEFEFKNVTLEKSGTIKFVVDLEDDGLKTTSKTITINTTFSRDTLAGAKDYVGKYDESNENALKKDFVGSISLSNIRLQPAKGSLQNSNTKEVEFLAKQNTKKVIFEGEYTAKRQDVTLNEFLVKETSDANLAADETIDFYLSIDGKDVGNVRIETNQNKADTTISDVLVKKGEKVKVRLEADVYGTAGHNYTYNLKLKGQDVNGNEAGVSDADTVKIKVVEDGSVNVSDNASQAKTVVLKSTNIKLANFVVKTAQNAADSKLSSLEIALVSDAAKGLTEKKNYRIKVGGSEVDVDDITIASDKITVSNLNETIAESGIEVEVSYKPELAVNDYSLKLVKVNNTTFAKEFAKKVVNALVSVEKQENIGGGSTKYTFKVEKADENTVITNLVLKVGSNPRLELGSVVNGDTAEVPNDPVSVAFIEEISYTADGAVAIKKAEYNDFFKVDGTYVKIFKAN